MYENAHPLGRDLRADNTLLPDKSLESKRRKTASEPFDSLLQELKPLGEKDPEIPAQATRLVGLYRNLWETYAAKCSDSQNVANENRRLEQSNKQLCQEKEQMERRFHEILKRMADIFESLGEHSTGSPKKLSQIERTS